MILEVSFILLFIFIATYEPIWGYISTQKFKARIRYDQTARINYYNSTMAGLWTPTIVILIIVGLTPLSLGDIGLSFVTINEETLGPWFTYGSIVLIIIYSLMLVINYIAIRVSPIYKEKAKLELERYRSNEKFGSMFPRTSQERKRWNYVSLTAGITEEIIYRGFLLYAILYFLPTLSIWIALVVAALLFGLAHTYQGVTGVIRTALIGFLFGAVYVSLESILPLILLHIIADTSSGVNLDK
ncbi:CPBP family intramembrane glutamic endopeptidase [Ammoniphilus sp. CFH 90114]|uniref:CPBP family intramembrane glutamic endopeptidase n=1 Tax=Ammoniphilus sp. CFH 90114 TaxID=2493665 RepID=UPI00100DEA80|nr:CPBP family intramembrane glutamic endopeptidase [Ammoniphilus sp. CFH 90114]RXT02817.1 CPBP family intramembrane metalloprotease [Ammoniphilus sp. CFH 90114]